MLYKVLYPLREEFFIFNIFKYITFRSALAALTAFLISIILGGFVIRKLKQFNVGERVREEHEVKKIYHLHKDKEGTPTMGGILVLASVVAATFLWADLDNIYVALAISATIFLGLIGFLDDFIKLKIHRKGLSATTKLIGQLLVGIGVGLILYNDPHMHQRLDIPFFKDLIVNLGVLYIPFVILIVVGTSNAVNLTDGLDGLAIGCTIMIALTYTALSYVAGHIKFSNYLNIVYVPGSGELAVFCAALVGAGLGFLWFNTYPAQVFLGDVGSLALGGAIGVTSVIIKKELILFIVGGIFVLEALSVIIQVASFKLRGKRVFLMSPLHHHFQIKGWAEPKIVVRFWIIAAVLALISLSTLKIR